MVRWAALAMLLVPGTAQATGVKVSVEVVGLRNIKGQVYCMMFNSPKGWPGDVKRAFKEVWVDIPQQKATCVFEDVPPGNYAVAGYHDENGNRNLDQGFMGIPTEGIVVSNDAKGFLGPPSFDASKFAVGTTDVSLVVHLRYKLL